VYYLPRVDLRPNPAEHHYCDLSLSQKEGDREKTKWNKLGRVPKLEKKFPDFS
jgi:hypothetical protein